MLSFLIWLVFLEYIDCSVCGDGICSDDESIWSCFDDCSEKNCSDIYQITEDGCISRGWEIEFVNVDGIEREYYFKLPEGGTWTNGSIIGLHGGSGSGSNFCYELPYAQYFYLGDILRGVPVADFGRYAVEQGFAVFSLNSARNRGLDSEGRPIGKRWECLATSSQPDNRDLNFIEKMILDVIPSKRSEGSSKDMFMVGISNGGFMTAYAATQFSEHMTSFATVSAADPYGTYFDMTDPGTRKCAPGTFRNSEPPNYSISYTGGCLPEEDEYSNEATWPPAPAEIGDGFELPFKMFYHELDSGVDLSCMEKLNSVLNSNGYLDKGSFVLSDGTDRNLEDHYWQFEYSQPILDFFYEMGLEYDPYHQNENDDDKNYDDSGTSFALSLLILFVRLFL